MKLEWWRRKLFSRAGTLQLVNFVLSSIPIYFTTYFPTTEMGNKQDWQDSKTISIWKGDGWVISMINWDCLSQFPEKWEEKRRNGSTNLEVQNISLLQRWWWHAYINPTASGQPWWLNCTGLSPMVIVPNSIRESFFWRQLNQIKPLFHGSCTQTVADEILILFR